MIFEMNEEKVMKLSNVFRRGRKREKGRRLKKRRWKKRESGSKEKGEEKTREM